MKTTPRLQVIVFAFIALVSCASLVYTINARHQTEVENAYHTRCLSELMKQSAETSNVRSEAAEERDNALVGSKKALRTLVYMRIIKGIPDGPEVQAAARDYMEQTQLFIEASEELNKTRKNNPIPSFEEFCKHNVK